MVLSQQMLTSATGALAAATPNDITCSSHLQSPLTSTQIHCFIGIKTKESAIQCRLNRFCFCIYEQAYIVAWVD